MTQCTITFSRQKKVDLKSTVEGSKSKVEKVEVEEVDKTPMNEVFEVKNYDA